MNKTKKSVKKKKNKAIKWLFRALGIFVLLFILLVLAVRSPWGQDIIVNQAVSYISEKTKTKVVIDRLFVTFNGNVQLDGLYLEDQQKDTLVYSRKLEIDVPFMPIIRGEGITIDYVNWTGLRAHVHRIDSLQGYNFQFLIDAFAKETPEDPTDKDDQSSGQDFQIGEVAFHDMQLTFQDEVTGMDSFLRLGNLDLEVEEMDLEKMNFHIANAAIANTKIRYKQTKSFPENDDSSSGPLPRLQVDSFTLDEFDAEYASIPDSLFAKTSIGSFTLRVPEADLEQQNIHIKEIALQDSDIEFQNNKNPKKEDIAEMEEQSGFSWPDWAVIVDEIALDNNSLSYTENDATTKKGVFQPEAIALKEVTFLAKNTYLKDQSAGITLVQLALNEASGLQLHNTALQLQWHENGLQLNDLLLEVNGTKLQGTIAGTYNSTEQLFNAPETVQSEIDLPDFTINLEALFLFAPELQDNKYLAELHKKPITGSLQASGKINSIKTSNTQLAWGKNTKIQLSGHLKDVTNPENMYLDIPTLLVASKRNDMVRFVDEKSTGIHFPENITLEGRWKGFLDKGETALSLQTTDGSLTLDGFYEDRDGIAFSADVEVDDFKLGQLLQNEQYGALTMQFKANGKGNSLNTLDGNLDATIQSLNFQEYAIKDWKLQGKMEEGKGTLESAYKDENLDVALESTLELDSINSKVHWNLDVKGADLQALGITPMEVRSAFQFQGDFSGNADRYNITSQIKDGVAVYDNQSYLLGDFSLDAFVDTDTTSLTINNKMLDVVLHSNADPARFSKAIGKHYKSYLSENNLVKTNTDTTNLDSIAKPVDVKIRAKIRQAPIMNDIFLTNLEQLDTVSIAVDFQEKNRALLADVRLPYINYSGNEIEDLHFHLNSDNESFAFGFGLQSITAGPVAIKETALDGTIANEKLLLNFSSKHKDETLLQLASEVSRKGDSVYVHMNPSDIVLNGKTWEIPESNQVHIAKNTLNFTDFVFSRNGQSMTFSNSLQESENKHIGVRFENFKLQALLSYFNPEQTLAKGDINGSILLENPFDSPGMLANLGINNLEALNIPLGTLKLDALATENESYSFAMGLKEGDLDMDADGEYRASKDDGQLQLNGTINKLQMQVLETLFDEDISDTKGYLSGDISVSGTVPNPKYQASFTFHDASFHSTKLNTSFTTSGDAITIDNEGLHLENFRIRDAENNTFSLAGDVITENFLNPEFDLKMNAKDFTLFNSSKDDNSLFYGKAIVDIDSKITGYLNVPKVDATVNIGAKTDVTYIIPESELEVVERDNVVLFVNRENPDDILNKTKEESVTVKGFDLQTKVAIHQDALFRIILDEQTNDNLQVGGQGDLDFSITPNGRTTLTGRYEIRKGHYEMSLYNLVKRRFELADNSSIVWSGDPMDATLDVRAIYRVETAASSLMAAQLSGSGPQVNSRYRQRLPFLVYLNIEGELMQPELHFNLDMPDDEQGALGGEVYGRIQQLNQQEEALNKQVFSLLVMNRFYPESGSDGSGGGAEAVARENINKALSEQLNALSGKLLGDSGLELDFGIDSYTDYQGESPQDRTQLDVTAQKRLFDDRVIVRVGGEVDVQGSEQEPGESSPVLGNVSVEYLITDDGRLRIKGFRKNEFENVIDGQLIISGIALIFTREFNKYRELWKGKEEDNTTKK